MLGARETRVWYQGKVMVVMITMGTRRRRRRRRMEIRENEDRAMTEGRKEGWRWRRRKFLDLGVLTTWT